MKNKKKAILLTIVFSLLPFLALADDNIETIVARFTSLFTDNIIPLFMVVAVAVFLYGIVRYILASGDQEKAKEAKSYIIYGLVGLFVMVCFWGLIKIVIYTFIPNTSLNAPSIPKIVPSGS